MRNHTVKNENTRIATRTKPSLRDSELRYRRLFETAQDGILILDAESGAIMDVNPFLMDMLAYTREEFLEKKLWEVGAFKDIKASQDAFQALQKYEYIRYKNLPLKTKDGQLVQVEFVSNVYLAGDTKVIQCNIRNITDRTQEHDALLKNEQYFREQSVRDYLTGLFNRRYMEETLERELLRSSRHQLSIGIIMIDVDDFKRFNDKFGHAAGDVILHNLGKLLMDNVRGEDIPSRYGGDEFLIVLPGAELPVTRMRGELLCEKARLFHNEFEGQTLELITLSIGVATFPKNGSTSREILKAADMALYEAKRNGQG